VLAFYRSKGDRSPGTLKSDTKPAAKRSLLRYEKHAGQILLNVASRKFVTSATPHYSWTAVSFVDDAFPELGLILHDNGHFVEAHY
jgi:hypothetical protein